MRKLTERERSMFPCLWPRDLEDIERYGEDWPPTYEGLKRLKEDFLTLEESQECAAIMCRQ